MEYEERLKEQAEREVELLKFINKIDHEKGFIVRLRESFSFSKKVQSSIKAEFTALVFEPLEVNLYDLMLQSSIACEDGSNRPRGLNLKFIKIIAW